MRNLVVRCNPHKHTHAREVQMLSPSRKDHPARKIFQEQQCTIQRETCVAFHSIVAFSTERKRAPLSAITISLSYRLNANSRREEEVGHAQQSGTDLWRKLLCLGPPERESRYPTFPLYITRAKGVCDPFIGILFPLGS